MTNVLFICTANVCRSPMAAELFRALTEHWQQQPSVGSAGTRALAGHPATEHTRTAMRELGLDIDGHRGRQVDRAILQQADIVLTMTPQHKENLIDHFAGEPSKINVLTKYAMGNNEGYIADPYGQNLSSHRSSARELMLHVECAVKIMENV